MIEDLMEDQKIAVVKLADQRIRRKFRIGPISPNLDLRLTNPVVSGLDSLTRTSDAVMEYSEVDELPNFNVKFNAKVSNVKTKVAAKGTVSETYKDFLTDVSGDQFPEFEEHQLPGGDS